MTLVHFHVLDVGQGMGHYIEIYEREGVLKHTVLADFGSEGYRHEAGDPTIAKVQASLRTMPQPTIDVLFLTHSDADHVNLLDLLLEPFAKYNGTANPNSLLIRRTVFGGEARNLRDIFKLVEPYMFGAQAEGLPPAFSSFDESLDEIVPFTTLHDVDVHLLIGNITDPKAMQKPENVRSRSEIRNTVSLVLLFTMWTTVDGQRLRSGFIITGDATAYTIAEVNEVLTVHVRELYLSRVLVVTAPHHGSYPTLLNLKNFEGSLTDNATRFVNAIRARSLAVSAEKSNYGHPSIEVIMLFYPRLPVLADWFEQDMIGLHFFVAYFAMDTMLDDGGRGWPSREDYFAMYTRRNIYTNLYAFADYERWIVQPKPQRMVEGQPPPQGFDPPTAVTWVFLASDTGGFVIEQWINRQNFDAELLERLALPPVPLPPGPLPPVSSSGPLPPVALPPAALRPTNRTPQVFP